MLLGERAGLDDELYRRLRSAGLAHLVAISGLHVGLLLVAVLAVVKRTRLPVGVACATTAIVLAAYGVMVGGRAPVARAVSGASLMLLGRGIHRDGNAVNTVAVVAIALVAWRPALLWDPGFRLSFLAAAGILLLGEPVARSLPLPRVPALAVGVSAAAYLATAPVAAWHFGRVAPAALISNLVAMPLCGWILSSAAATVALQPVPGLASLAAASTSAGIDALLELATIVAAHPGSSWRVPAPAPSLSVAYYLLLGMGARRRAGSSRRPRMQRSASRASALVLASCIGLVHLGPFPTRPDAEMEVVVADVGQAQSVLVRGPGGGCVVVDAAGTSGGRFDLGERVVAPLLSSEGCGRIDVLVVTHDHDDHVGGAMALARDLEIGEVWYGVESHRRSRIRILREAARAGGTAAVGVRRGFVARRAGLLIEVLHPDGPDARLDLNNRSVVVRISAGRRRVLIVGDLEGPGERALLAAGVGLEADLLVVGHHGAAAATSPAFLARAGPSFAAISVGAWNRFGHPAPRVIALLRRTGVRVYRTDRDGVLRFRADPEGWRAPPRRELRSRAGPG
jgi:competence protein ComEC